MKLATHHEGVILDLGNFDQVCIGIDTRDSQTSRLELIAVFVIDFVSMAMALTNGLFAVELARE